MSNLCCLTPKDVSRILGIALEDLLGTISYQGGQTRKAVSINKLNKEGEVTGLELVISPTFSTINQLRVWVVYLVARDDEATLKLSEVSHRFERLFRKGLTMSYLNANFDLTQYPQLACRIPYGLIQSLGNRQTNQTR